mgnify:CR=1 FL=1
MAIPTINFKGFLYDDAGDGVSGARIDLFAKNATTTSLANDTTDSDGAWDINYTTAGTAGLDIQIKSGDSYRRIKYDDKIHLAELDTALLNIRAIESDDADMFFYADEGEDAGDRWRIRVANAGVMTFGNDIQSQASYVAHVTITPNATVANSTFAIAGNVTVGNALTVTGTTTLNGNLVLGDAAADTLTVGATLQGASPLTFEGGTADGYETTFAITDPTADRTITFPNLSGTVQLSANPITGTTIDASTDFTIGNTVITDGVVTDSTGLQLAANLDINGTADISGAVTLGTVAAAGADTDKFLVLDGSGNVDYRTGTQVASDIGAVTGATALDDIATGDAAASLVTTVGNITIDAQATDADVIIKVDDNGSAVTAVTFDGSDEGNALFVNDIKLISDSAVLSLGDGNDFTITHDGTTGATLAGNPITITSGGAATWSSSAGALTLTSAAATTWSTAAGVLTIDGDDGIVLNTGGSGNVQVNENLVVGVDDTGYDVTFFGASAGSYMLWDEDANLLDIRGATAAGPGHLKLTTGELTVVDADILGRIDFQAPLESDGSDAVLVGASIWAEADDTFSGTVNNTDIVFATGKTATAAERFRFTADNEIGIAGANYGTDGQVLTSGGAGAAVTWGDVGGLDYALVLALSGSSVYGHP